MCAVMESRSEGPFVRHQISPVPKARPDQVSPAGLRGGETRALRSGSGFCLHERGLWISPTRADRGRLQKQGRLGGGGEEKRPSVYLQAGTF